MVKIFQISFCVHSQMTNKKRQGKKRVKTENWKKNHFHLGL